MFSKLNFNVDKKMFSRFLLLAPYLIITIILIVIPLILVFIKPFQPTVDSATNESIAIANNWSFLGTTIWEKIGLSFLVAIIVTIICVVIGYAFAYFLSLSKSLPAKIFAISLMTSPMWISFLIKLVGLKEIFDFINGQANSTYGLIYTIIALVYVNLPTFILTIYTFLNTIPKNLLEASKDLGKNCVQTFFQVILPYTKNAVFSGITLIFLPTLTTAGVTQFMDNSNNGELIGSILLDKGLEGTASQIALARVATLSLVVCLIILVLWSIAVLIPKSVKHYKKMKKGNLNA
ncbi:MAG: ABC transporter permease subunit [Malacoplasma sp.]|nr:ABC transporter permease subunit [Malacoplasma sp.]MDE5774814.1 ABC transporter permease subunit [Malacoplasma sp.]MDE7099617.1 ABC transporter permease subunit [Malacoplasma sp.]